MAKATIRYSDYFAQTVQRMRQDGLLLVTASAAGKPNAMTIGWGAIGSIWGRPPIIAECAVHCECRTVHKNDVVPEALVQAVVDDAYAAGDFHRVYFGEIVAAYADVDAAQRLLEPAGALPITGP